MPLAPEPASGVSHYPPAFRFVQHTCVSSRHLLNATQTPVTNKIYFLSATDLWPRAGRRTDTANTETLIQVTVKQPLDISKRM